MRYIRLVREFNEALDPDSALPEVGWPKPGKRLLRAQLVLEEIGEVAEALCSGDLFPVLCETLDLQYVVDGCFMVYGVDRAMEIDDNPLRATGVPRLPQTEDGSLMQMANLANRASVLIGTMIGGGNPGVIASTGMQLRLTLHSFWENLGVSEELRWAMFQALHAANMAKLGGGVNAAGRVQKPEGWKKADQRMVLAQHNLMIPEGSSFAIPLPANEGAAPC